MRLPRAMPSPVSRVRSRVQGMCLLELSGTGVALGNVTDPLAGQQYVGPSNAPGYRVIIPGKRGDKLSSMASDLAWDTGTPLIMLFQLAGIVFAKLMVWGC